MVSGRSGMEETTFWQTLFATCQSLTDWVKALWLIVPPAFILLLTAPLLRAKRPAPEVDGELVCTLRRDAAGQYRILRHVPSDDTRPCSRWSQTSPPLIPLERQGAR